MPDVWLSYDELAERLGIARESARVLARRRNWARQRSNDGRTLVRVDAEALTAPVSGGRPPLYRPDTRPGEADMSGGRPPIYQGDSRNRHEAEIDRIEARHTAEIERMTRQMAEREAQHREQLDRLTAQHSQEISRLERAYKAASDALMEKVATVLVANRRRPWWRLLG